MTGLFPVALMEHGEKLMFTITFSCLLGLNSNQTTPTQNQRIKFIQAIIN